MKRLALAVLVLIPLAVAGCGAQKEYVAADEKTYGVVAPEFLRLVEAAKNPDGTPQYAGDKLQSWKDTVATWRLRIDKNK